VDSIGKVWPFRIGSGKPAVPVVTRPYVPGSKGAPVRGVVVQPNHAVGFLLDAIGGLHAIAIAGGTALATHRAGPASRSPAGSQSERVRRWRARRRRGKRPGAAR
jgi:hypothetical protein